MLMLFKCETHIDQVTGKTYEGATNTCFYDSSINCAGNSTFIILSVIYIVFWVVMAPALLIYFSKFTFLFDYINFMAKFVMIILHIFNKKNVIISAICTLMILLVQVILLKSEVTQQSVKYSSEREKLKRIIQVDLVMHICLIVTVLLSTIFLMMDASSRDI